MKKLIKTGKEIDRILESGIEILPNSPIHEKLKKALNIAGVTQQSELLKAFAEWWNANCADEDFIAPFELKEYSESL